VKFFFLFRSRRKRRRSAVSLFFLVVGREKVVLPSLFLLSVGALLATLTVHRVPCDSVAHDAELGSVRESLDRGQRDGYKGERVRCGFRCVPCFVCPPPSNSHINSRLPLVCGCLEE
jgi:hypothetical protein